MIHLFTKLEKSIPKVTGAISQSSLMSEIIMQNSNLRIRNMAFPELNKIRESWLVNEGWPAVKHGLPATYSLDPDGFYCLEKEQETIASISFVAYPEIKMAYVGFYVVPPTYRGQGYGKTIFKMAESFTTANRDITTIGLNCHNSMSAMYNKWGFRTVTVDDIWKLTATDESPVKKSKNLLVNNIASSRHEAMLDALVNYDASVFGTKRFDFLYKFINKPETITAIYTDGEVIKGYGIISSRLPAKAEPHNSYRIGPLYANDLDIARSLLQQLVESINLKSQESVFLETPGNNPASEKMLTMFEFQKIASMDKMYKGTEPKFDTKKMFCYTSLATGG